MRTLVLGVLLWSGLASAQELHEHDGFMLRVNPGPTFLWMHSKGANAVDAGDDITESGIGVHASVSIGWTLVHHLSIFAHFLGDIAIGPTVTANGTTVMRTDAQASLLGGGAGASYYVQPLNLFVSAAILATSVRYTEAQDNFSSNVGFGFTLSAAKEWWIPRKKWGLGVGGQFSVASMHDDHSASRFTSTAVSVVFSASYH